MNVQSNSENYGFNTFDKYENKFDYLCIDEKELRYGLKDRYSSIESLISKIPKNGDVSITLGTNGSYFEKRVKNLLRPQSFLIM